MSLDFGIILSNPNFLFVKEKITSSIRYIVSENSKLEFFVLLSLLYLFSAIIVNEYILVDELYYRSLGDQVSLPVIDQVISFKNKWQWLGYVSIPAILALKFLLISTFLSMGALIAGHTLTFRQIFAITMIAELVYLAAGFVSTGSIIFSDINTLDDLNVDILSLASFVTESEIESYLYFPMKSISLFLMIYILFITYCYNIITGFPFRKSFHLILSTYGTAFILWNILVMYLLISYA